MHQITILTTTRVGLWLNCDPELVPNCTAEAREKRTERGTAESQRWGPESREGAAVSERELHFTQKSLRYPQ